MNKRKQGWWCLAVILLGAGVTCAQAPQAKAGATESAAAKSSVAPAELKAGPFDVSILWRTRVENWGWFEGAAGNSDYSYGHSMLRVGIGQKRENFDWFVEGEQATILGLPTNAVVAGPEGQLGLGGTYYAANGNHANNAGAFLKQAFVNLKRVGPVAVKLGRFEFFDGTEVIPRDPMLAAVVKTRIAHRLISNFGFTAVQRTFDGGEVAWNSGENHLTFFAARPTAGIFQVQGMDELNIEVAYGAWTRTMPFAGGESQLRVFGLDYVDGRNGVLKTDNRPLAVRAADHGGINLSTWGANYETVVHTRTAGSFDVLAWGAVQAGSWGALAQRSGAFVGEAGWQPPVKDWKPWISAGYSWGSGDGNPNDQTHGTFFQVLTTPRLYARLPYYNMMNNTDAYVTLNLHPSSKLALRSEAHRLGLASARDLWYLGGGAFQAQTFGYVGRPSNGKTSLGTVWDVSANYSFNRFFSMNAYYGHSWGGDVVAAIYPNHPDAHFAFLETDLQW